MSRQDRFSWFSTNSTRQHRRRRAKSACRTLGRCLGRRLHVEQLEDRRMLAVITVTSLADNLFADGEVTLREAIVAANTNLAVGDAPAGSVGADTIEFSAALSGDTIILGGLELAITEALTIDATALANNVTIDADNASRIFNFTATTGDLTLSALTITGGLTIAIGDDGGGIRFDSDGTLTINSSTVSGNSTTTGFSSAGGGIYTSSGAVTLTDSTVSGNSSGGDGGGIFTFSGTVTLISSTVSGNSSGGDGGGIRTFTGDVVLTDSTVSGNSSTGSSADGGGIFTASGNVTLTGSTVSGNSSGDASGGIFTSSGTVTLTSSTVSGNSNGGGIGGGIRTFDGDVALTDSIVSGNSSGEAGGGISTSFGDVVLTGSTISGNSTTGSSANGGGIFTATGNVTLTSSTVTGNSAVGAGGGVYVFNAAGNPMLTITNSIVAGNTAGGAGPDLVPDPDSTLNVNFSLIGDTTDSGITAGTGSGNILDELALLGSLANNGGPTLTHALLAGSPAIDAGDPGFTSPPNFDQRGAPFVRGVGARIDMGAYERQTVAGMNLTVDTNVDESDGNYSASDLSLREAVGLANGSIGVDTITFAAALSGGTIILGGTELEISGTLTIDATALANNVTIDADNASRVFNFTATTGDLTLSGLTITGGQTIGVIDDGGGIRFLSNGTLALNNSSVSGNSTTGSAADGGGIYANSGAVTLTSSTVSGNDSTGNYSTGGGIRTISGTVTLTGSTVSGNTATGTFAPGGGGISTSFGAVTLNSSTVTGNSTAGAGGGISVSNSLFNPTLTISNSIVAGNTDNGTAADLRPDPDGALNVNFSLIGNTTGSGINAGTGTGNILNQPALLGPLANNGGPTLTHALLAGSPAIDAGDPAFDPNAFTPALVNDQRGTGFDREVGGRIDIGAYELQTAVNSADFDTDGDIDGFDFLTWQRGFGTPIATPADGDANNDNNVDAADLGIWESQFGGPAPLAAVSSQTSEVSSQLSAVAAPPAETAAARAPAVSQRAELIDAAIAIESIRGGQVPESLSFVEEPAFVETYADRVFAVEAIVPAVAFADEHELFDANSGGVDKAETSWLSDKLLERVFG